MSKSLANIATEPVKGVEKLNEISNKISIVMTKIAENIDKRLNALELVISANSNPSNTISEELIKELKEIAKTGDVNNQHSTKELNAVIATLDLKIDKQITSLSSLEKYLEQENITNIISSFSEKLNTIEDNQSTDGISILEKLNNLELQVTQTLELNSQLGEKLNPLENYLVTIVKALTKLYENNNELKAMQAQNAAKLDNIIEILNSLSLEEEQDTNLDEPQDIVNTTHKVSFFAKVKNLFFPQTRLKPN